MFGRGAVIALGAACCTVTVARAQPAEEAEPDEPTAPSPDVPPKADAASEAPSGEPTQTEAPADAPPEEQDPVSQPAPPAPGQAQPGGESTALGAPPDAEAAESAPAAEPTEEDPDADLAPAEFRLGSSGFIAHVGGFVRLDAIYDFNGMGSVDQFNPRTIPLDGSGEPNLYFDPRKSRAFFEMRYPNSFADLAGRIEIDFMTDNKAPRIRRAFASVGRLLFGQEWTVFTEAAWIPPTLDFEAPTAYVLQRSPQVQYTQPLGSHGFDATVSAEYLVPTVSDDLAAAVPGEVDVLVPDFVLRLRYARGGAHASLHFLMRNGFYDPEGGDRVHHRGRGVNAILGYAFEAGHRVYLQGVLGDAIGSYRGGDDFNLDAYGNALPAKVYGLTGGTEVSWLPNRVLSSNFVGSVTTSVGESLPGTTNGELAVYAAASFVWSPIPYFKAGLEYLFGYYEDHAAHDGYNNRLQLTLQATLP